MNIYKTTNKVNGKIYVGKDVTHGAEYLGSGVLLRKAIKKYGKENFEKTIIEECFSVEDLNAREVFWIKSLNSTDKKIGYNIAFGGTGGDTTTNLSDEKKKEKAQKFSESMKRVWNRPGYRERAANKMSSVWTPEYTKMMSEKMTGRKITWGKKMSEGIRRWNETHKRVISEETKNKLSKASKGKELTKVTDEIERRVIELYAQCGAKRMSARLADEGHKVSPYIIRRILKKNDIYEKWRKKRPELS